MTGSFFNPRKGGWKVLGGVVIAGSVLASGWMLYQGPTPLKPHEGGTALDHGAEGRQGNITQQLGNGRFVLNFDTIAGDKDDLKLSIVKGHLEEPQTLWVMNAPSARRTSDIWFLDGPMDFVSQTPGKTDVLGQGTITPVRGPALKWDHGVWTGLGTLNWNSISGPGKGAWTMPPGWRRELDGRFVAEKGPVVWKATEPGMVKTMEAANLWASTGFQSGRMEQVEVTLEDGKVWSQAQEMDPLIVKWFPPIRFERNDGWNGDSSSAQAPRPEDGKGLEKVEMRDFHAQKAVPDGRDELFSEGVRWTPAGLRLEGSVRWLQPLDGNRLTLKAPRVLIREAAGSDLPEDLPAGHARAEGFPVLSWGARALSSPRMEVVREKRSWTIQAPVNGRGEMGTFSAGPGKGNPAHWEFEGPIRASVNAGGSLRGDHLIWEAGIWTLTGRPATWNGNRQRLSGPRIVRSLDRIQFPESLSGALAAAEGDLTIRADQADGNTSQVTLDGRVECRGQNWRLRADRMIVHLNSAGVVRAITAQGNVSLKGSQGEGWGETLELDLNSGFHSRWLGRVNGIANVEVQR